MEHTLKRGSLSILTKSHGAELVSFKNGEKEYIWQGDARYWSGQNPNLFPNIGAVKEYGAYFDGTAYPLMRHGFGRHSGFIVAEQGDTYIVYELRENAETLKQYPFPFIFRVRHGLTEKGFYTQYEITNPGKKPLPFCVGGHPAFNCPMNEGEEFSHWHLVFDETEDAYARLPLPGGFISDDNREYILRSTNTITLDHAVHDRVDTLIFEGLRSTGVSLVGPDGHGIRMDFADFPMIAFWTAPGKNAPYICLEPWLGCGAYENENGEFADKHLCAILVPGETKTLRYTISII